MNSLSKLIATPPGAPVSEHEQERLWTASEVAEYLGVSTRQVAERYSKRGDFPRCVRLPADKGRGHRRWFPAEIMQWAEGKRDE